MYVYRSRTYGTPWYTLYVIWREKLFIASTKVFGRWLAN